MHDLLPVMCCMRQGRCLRYGKMYDLLPVSCWYLYEAWQDVRFVACDLLVSVSGMARYTIFSLQLAGISWRHGEMNDLLSVICWHLCKAWQDVRFVACDLLEYV